MRGVIWLVLLFVVAVVAATTLGSNDGLVSLYWRGWRTDLSLNLFVILILGACAVVLLSVQALNALVSLPQRAGQWRALRRERAAQAALREALAEFFGARYGRAHKAAQRALALQPDAPELAGDPQFRLLSQLLAAGSLHKLQDRPRRDASLKAGLKSAAGDSGDGARLLAAEWALDDRDAARALAMLDALPPGAARRTQALRLRLQATRLARQPLESMRTARLLANHQAFSPLVAQSLLRSLAGETLETAHDVQQLRRLWGQFDSADRRDTHVACRAATWCSRSCPAALPFNLDRQRHRSLHVSDRVLAHHSGWILCLEQCMSKPGLYKLSHRRTSLVSREASAANHVEASHSGRSCARLGGCVP